jgi:hypothetical protein
MFSSHAAHNKTLGECKSMSYHDECLETQWAVIRELGSELVKTFEKDMPSCILEIRDEWERPRIVAKYVNRTLAEIVPYGNAMLLRVDITAGKSVFFAPFSTTEGYYWDDAGVRCAYTEGAMAVLCELKAF